VSEFIEKYNLTATGYGKPALFEEKEVFTIEAIGLGLVARDFFPRYEEEV